VDIMLLSWSKKLEYMSDIRNVTLKLSNHYPEMVLCMFPRPLNHIGVDIDVLICVRLFEGVFV
jgi:hypothetical protein